jgi:hypothetical protein
LARILSEQTGWVVRDSPDDKADINYFFPYLEVIEGYNRTLTAAWFTHHDTMQKGKSPLWDRAAEAVDLRTVSAGIYLVDLESVGLSEVVIPPLDRNKFVIDENRISPDMIVIGTSGWVYPGGRKGEHLLAQLTDHAKDFNLHITAIGQGWPVENTRTVSWEKLQTWYQSLDIYLCTSLIEGVGYGPLEALACGKQVIIPKDVGVFNDLPDCQGIWRYRPGDFDSMLWQIKNAIRLESLASPQRLRETVREYTAENWAKSHIAAFERLLKPRPPQIALSEAIKNCGVYYVAFGAPSRKMAKKAISSFKKYMPDVEAMLVSDGPLNAGEDHFCEQADQDIGGRIAKIKIDTLIPEHWQYILYLDADTEVIADISFLYQVLIDGWELVICKNPGKYHELSQMLRPDNEDETNYTFEQLGSRHLLQLNGGVLGYRRNENTRRFFELWVEEWNRYGKRDQAALHRALYVCPLKTYVLGNEWNCITRYDDPSRSAGILHYPTTARRWSGRIDGRLDSEEAWRKVLK